MTGDEVTGWRMVPIEPTEAMNSAGLQVEDADGVHAYIDDVYAAMLAAAPLPPPVLDLEKVEKALAGFARAAGFFALEGREGSETVVIEVMPALSGALTVDDFRFAASVLSDIRKARGKE